jgi:uncharacterized protein YdaU (DUF1376 family)
MTKKDPAFLFYSKDWLEGTAEMLPEEKGVYIDLLCHQHQKGSLPIDTKRLAKIVGLAEQEFLFIWAGIKVKFIEIDDRFYNRKLTDVVTERLEKGDKNKIIGTLAAVVRLSKESDERKYEAKKGFNYQTFIGFKNQFLTEAITEWFNSRLKSIGNANANEDANNSSYKESTLKEGGTGETRNGIGLFVNRMHQFWIEQFPHYTIDHGKDTLGLINIYSFIVEQAKVEKIGDPEDREMIFDTFKLVANHIKTDGSWWQDKSLQTISGKMQVFYNAIKLNKNGNGKSATNGRSKKSVNPTTDELQTAFARRYPQSE